MVGARREAALRVHPRRVGGEASAYLAAAFPDELIDSWIAMKKQEAEYVYNAPVPQEYELYF